MSSTLSMEHEITKTAIDSQMLTLLISSSQELNSTENPFKA